MSAPLCKDCAHRIIGQRSYHWCQRPGAIDLVTGDHGIRCDWERYRPDADGCGPQARHFTATAGEG